MPTPADSQLVRAAMRARGMAVAPYSRFAVGAALATRTGDVFTGANVESASFGLSCCAERVALFKALTEGARNFDRIAIVARHPGGVLPCGACRQLLAEQAPDATVLVADTRRPARIRKFTVVELLPEAFREFGVTKSVDARIHFRKRRASPI
jgi:cytidine deaminase